MQKEKFYECPQTKHKWFLYNLVLWHWREISTSEKILLKVHVNAECAAHKPKHIFSCWGNDFYIGLQ